MGARADLPRALIGAALLGAGCLDFEAPLLPALGAPPVLQADIRIADDGTIRLSGRLDRGLDDDGFRREVPVPALRLDGRTVQPADTLPDGAIVYSVLDTLGSTATQGPFTLVAPGVAGVDAVPSLSWAGLTRLDGDTVRMRTGEDLVLRVAASSALPGPARRQWLLSVSGDTAGSVLGGDGTPPDSIVLPARYVPAGDTLSARLTWSLSARVEPPPGDYILLVSGDSRLNWTVIVADTAEAGR